MTKRRETKITTDEWLAAVCDAIAPPPDDPGFSVREVMEKHPGKSYNQVAGMLDKAVDAGKLVAGAATRVVANRRSRVRVYRPA